jgi:hypothetical protein
MPVVRVCAHCKKSMLASTYQLIDHVFNKCPVYKEKVKIKQDKKKINIIKISVNENNLIKKD